MAVSDNFYFNAFGRKDLGIIWEEEKKLGNTLFLNLTKLD